MQCVKCFPDDNIPLGKFPLERETISESAQTTEGSNSSEHDADDNAESVDKPAHDKPDLDEQLLCPIPDQDKMSEETSEEVPQQLLDLKKSNSFLN